MKTFLFQLGHSPSLSHAEILSINLRLSQPLSSLRCFGNLLLAEVESWESLSSIADELGGTIRICEVIASRREPTPTASTFSEEFLYTLVSECGLVEKLLQQNSRPVFGLSWLGEPIHGMSRKAWHGVLRGVAGRIKTELREKQISSRFLLPAEESALELTGAQVEKNHLLREGGELVFTWETETGWQLSLTRWLQPFEAFSKRDYGRPGRDPRRGMLPPKLARMLVQLARQCQTRTLLDPFCGSGSLLMEAGMLGLQATGIDLLPKAVQHAQQNWTWVQEHVGPQRGSGRALAGDARTPHTLCEPLSFYACAPEPTLGPPQKRPLSQAQFDELCQTLTPLYLRALGEIRTVVKPGARVVFVTPRFQLQNTREPRPVSLLADLKFLGYTLLDPLNAFAPTTRRATLIYSRPDQIVQREIIVLQA